MSDYIGGKYCPFILSEQMLVKIGFEKKPNNADAYVIFHDGESLLPLSAQVFRTAQLPTGEEAPAVGEVRTFDHNGKTWVVVNTQTPMHSRKNRRLKADSRHVSRIGSKIAAATKAFKRVSIPADELYGGYHGLPSTLHELAYGIQTAGYNTSYLGSSPSIKRKTKYSIRLFAPMKDEYYSYIHAAEDSARSIHLGRIIGDTPSNIFNTKQAVAVAEYLGENYDLDVRIIKKKELKKDGYGGIWNVGRGAAKRNPPAIAVLSRIVDKKAPVSAYVGKGLVFDTGGVQDKGPVMGDMHLDMLGMADVLVTAFRIGLQVERYGKDSIPHNFLGVVGIAENASGPDAYHPTDVITMKSGDTVNVYHTDAEGRLVLADCITLAQEYIAKHHKNGKGSTLVESSTLTGAILSGLGPQHAAIYADEELREQLRLASRLSGDFTHDMPFDDEDAGYLDANLKTSKGDFASGGGKYGGSLIAARFLAKFVKLPELEFAHIDRAGPMMGGVDAAGMPVNGAGAHGSINGLMWHHFRSRGPNFSKSK